MTDAKLQRYCAMGGIAFVILGGIGSIIAGSPPAVTDSGTEIFEYFDDHQTTVRAASYLNVLGVFFLLFFVAALWSTLRRAEGGAPRLTVVAGLGAVLGGAGAGASFAVTSMMALRHEALRENGMTIFYSLSFTLFGISAVGIAAMVLATSVIALRSRVFPSWVAWGGMALTVVWLVAALAIATDKDFIGTLGIVSFVLWSVWILAISVLMIRAPEPA